MSPILDVLFPWYAWSLLLCSSSTGVKTMHNTVIAAVITMSLFLWTYNSPKFGHLAVCGVPCYWYTDSQAFSGMCVYNIQVAMLDAC